MNDSVKRIHAGGLGALLDRVASLGVSAGAGFVLTLSGFSVTFNSARFGAALAGLLLLHLVRAPRVSFTREAAIYLVLIAYLVIQLVWTDYRSLAINTLLPSANFLLAMVLFGTLAAFHDLRTVLAGFFLGFAAACAAYTISSGFPFSYPADFSYNAIAGMYLFGLFVALVWLLIGRWNGFWLATAAILMGLIVATTSIKTNFGILAGAVASLALHTRYVAGALRSRLWLLVALLATLAIAVTTSETLTRSVERGFGRVSLGIEVLRARENLQGYSAFDKRAEWAGRGLQGWAENPVFGHGVEAYRAQFGLTSHTSAIDLLYNSGSVGFLLFYGVIASVLRRVYRAGPGRGDGLRALIVGTMTCYAVISLAGNVHYSAVLAAVIGVSVTLLRKLDTGSLDA